MDDSKYSVSVSGGEISRLNEIMRERSRLEMEALAKVFDAHIMNEIEKLNNYPIKNIWLHEG